MGLTHSEFVITHATRCLQNLLKRLFLQRKRDDDVTGTSRYYYCYINTLSILGSTWGRISIVIHIILFKQDLLLLIPVTENVIHGRVFSTFRLSVGLSIFYRFTTSLECSFYLRLAWALLLWFILFLLCSNRI